MNITETLASITLGFLGLVTIATFGFMTYTVFTHFVGALKWSWLWLWLIPILYVSYLLGKWILEI